MKSYNVKIAIPNFIDDAFENRMSQQENSINIVAGKGDD